MEMLMMLDCQKKTENARTWALSATVSFDATPSLNFKNPLKLKKNRRGFSLDSLHSGHVESDTQQQDHQLLHHYYNQSDPLKDQGLALPLSHHHHQQDHHQHPHNHHLTAAGLMQAVAAEIQLNGDQEQLTHPHPTPSQNSPYPVYSYYRSEGEKENHVSDLPWR